MNEKILDQMKPVYLVTIIALDSLESRILEDFGILEIRGFTVSAAEGQGLSRERRSDWEGKNIRIETLVSSTKAEKLVECIKNKYFEKYGVILFASEVRVLRPEKFT